MLWSRIDAFSGSFVVKGMLVIVVFEVLNLTLHPRGNKTGSRSGLLRFQACFVLAGWQGGHCSLGFLYPEP